MECGTHALSPRTEIVDGDHKDESAEDRKYQHCLGLVWEGTQTNLLDFIEGSGLNLSNLVKWVVNGVGKASHDLDIGAEPPDPTNPRQWGAPPTTLSTYLHHDAAFEMLSDAVTTHRHHATYEKDGSIITEGVRAGRPQRYDSVAQPALHRQEDLEPFIRALQLDGNPCLPDTAMTDLERPMIYQGGYLNQYFECRPPTPVQPLAIEIVIADYDSAQWDALPEGKVILSDKETRIKVTITPIISPNPVPYFDFLGNSLTLKTSKTMPTGVQIPISTANTTYSLKGNSFEIRKTLSGTELKSLGLLPQNNSGTFSKAWLDTGSDNPSSDSNLSDGLAFETLNAVSRGRSTNYGTLEDVPPNSPLHVSFFQAAGVEIITAECVRAKSKPRQLMNQADVFYYSGHGTHASGAVTYGNPTSVQPYWNQNLKVAIFAGCSVLDINDYNNNFGNKSSPGKLWEPVGPSVLLGYNYYAPTDLQNSAQIISNWIATRGTQGDVNAWMNANDNSNGRNACAIEKNLQYTYFHKYAPLIYWKTTVKKEKW